MPAVERYDGPAFRVLRKYLRDNDDQPPVVRILSAEYGLISPDDQIPLYDRRMTEGRAKELQPAVTSAFKPFCDQIGSLLVVASGAYVLAMERCFTMLKEGVAVSVTSGSIGRQVSELREWLYGEAPAPAPVTVGDRATIRGREIRATVEQVLEVARRNLPGDESNASKFETWCVPVGERHVAAKWLVSKLSGLAVADFRTADALNMLRKLGVEVSRVSGGRREQVVRKDACP